jgi:peptidoglycan glycosyltransferase
MNRAIRRVSLACLIMFVALLVMVNYVQGFEASSLANKPGNGRTFAQQFQYQRGSIITADQKVIAASKTVKGIYKYQRYYPDGPVYAPVTGYDSLYSATGIEQAENKQLSGSDPALAVHNLIDLISGKPKKGATVQLTINSKAQQAAYSALAATRLPNGQHAQAGLVAINPQSGAILALASYPTFDPNAYATLDGTQLNKIDNQYRHEASQPLLNRAINDTFPPGSTFKIVTGSTAFSTGKYNTGTNVYAPTNLNLPGTSKQLINYDNEACNNGSNNSGNGKVPLIYAFTISCNTVFGNLGMKLGGSAIQRQANKFGMNNSGLTIPLPVSPSNYPAVSDKALTAYSAIGQYNDTVTPLQEAMFAAAIANNGVLMKPYLVQKVTAPDLTTLSTTQQSVLSRAVSPTVASEVKKMMINVTSQPYGTAHLSAGTAATGGIVVAAKTGTAQNGINNVGLDDAVFTSFAPASNPQIAVGVVVKGGGLGADASAPIAVKVIKAYLAAQGKS